MNTKTIFLSAALCGSLPALAQSSDEHVYKTDVIKATFENLSANERKISKEHGVYLLYSSFTSFIINFELDGEQGLVSTSSPGLLKQIEVNWTSINTSTGSVPTLEVYTSDKQFEHVSDVFNLSTVDKVTEFEYQENNPRQSFVFQNGRYVGLKPVNNNVHLSSITLTWQLAHFRDNQTIDRLGTLCLPYNVSAEDLQGQIIPFTVAGKITGSDGRVSQIILEEAQNIEAGVPYIYIAKTQNVCLKYSQESSYTTSPQNFKGLYGTLTSTTVSSLSAKADDVFVISNNAFTLAGTDVSIPANRAYICMSEVPECGSPSTARQLIIGPDGYELIGGSPTEALSSPRQQANKVIDYDINGRIISTTSAPRVILRKGRKVINPSAQIFR